jgi:hypothetical protein
VRPLRKSSMLNPSIPAHGQVERHTVLTDPIRFPVSVPNTNASGPESTCRIESARRRRRQFQAAKRLLPLRKITSASASFPAGLPVVFGRVRTGTGARVPSVMGSSTVDFGRVGCGPARRPARDFRASGAVGLNSSTVAAPEEQAFQPASDSRHVAVTASVRTGDGAAQSRMDTGRPVLLTLDISDLCRAASVCTDGHQEAGRHVEIVRGEVAVTYGVKET